MPKYEDWLKLQDKLSRPLMPEEKSAIEKLAQKWREMAKGSDYSWFYRDRADELESLIPVIEAEIKARLQNLLEVVKSQDRELERMRAERDASAYWHREDKAKRGTCKCKECAIDARTVQQRVDEAVLVEAEWWIHYHKLNQPLGPYDVGENRIAAARSRVQGKPEVI